MIPERLLGRARTDSIASMLPRICTTPRQRSSAQTLAWRVMVSMTGCVDAGVREVPLSRDLVFGSMPPNVVVRCNAHAAWDCFCRCCFLLYPSIAMMSVIVDPTVMSSQHPVSLTG